MTQDTPANASRPRPLSPHIGIYRWQIPMITSILHRASGVMLTAGAVAVALWVYTAAYAPRTYDSITEMFTHPLGKAAIAVWALAFYYHLLNGLRHLSWDAGWGFSIPVAMRTGKLVLAGAVLLTALNMYCAFYR